MKFKTVLILSFFLFACDSRYGPEGYKCSSEQLDNVKKEFDICIETNYMSDYCFLQAKSTQCELIMVENEKQS